MEAHLIINNLQLITTSRLYSVSKLYNLDVNTSNVSRLIKALQSIKKEDRVECKVTVDVSFDEVLDILDALNGGVEAYNLKYKVRTFPKHFNTYQLIDALNKIDAKQLVKNIFMESAREKPKKNTKSKENIQVKELTMLERRRIELMNKGL